MALRQWTVMVALVLLVLGIVACAGLETSEPLETVQPSEKLAKDDERKVKITEEPLSSCGLSFQESRRHHEGFLNWTPGLLAFGRNKGRAVTVLQIVDQEKLSLSTPTTISANLGISTRFGVYGDLSPDGTQLVYTYCVKREGEFEIAVVNLETNKQLRLTENLFLDHYPVWSPDGKRIAFVSDDENTWRSGLYTMAADGTEVQRLTPSEEGIELAPPVWSPDGERLAFAIAMRSREDFRLYLYTVRSDGSELTKIAETSFVIRPPDWNEFAPAVPAWSPDGQFLAFIGGTVARDHHRDNSTVYEEEEAAIYTVRVDGTDLRQVFVMKPHGPLPDASGARLAAGEFYPYFPKISQVLWSPDGAELLFFANGAHLINVDGSNLRRLSPPVLEGVAAWSPDGSRIAVFEMGNAESPQVVWTAAGRYRTLEYVPGESVLLTVARNGSDLQTLLEGIRSYLYPMEPPAQVSIDLTACREGTVVTEPLANPGLVADCEALLLSSVALFRDSNLKWNGETPLAEWEGVTLGGESLRVHEVKLEKMNGVLPPALGQLSELRRLEIRGAGSKQRRHIGARLSGGIPAELGNLTKLEVLDLRGNFLTGFIPVELSELENLEALWLEDNFLSGSIPAELGNLANLRSLNLGRNNLHGVVPAALGGLSQLDVLHLWSNQLTGGIPPELGNLSQLTALWLSSNRLTGGIPPELGNLTQLQRLSLSVNRLSGEIPPELGNLSQLTALWLSSNRLTGSLPPELGSLSQLVNLYLTNNQLDGSIPAELGSLSQLERLHLSYNQLTGSIPPELSNLSQLRWLDISANAFSGCVAAELPDLWVRASGLERCA